MTRGKIMQGLLAGMALVSFGLSAAVPASAALADTPAPITAAPDGDTSPDILLQMCQASGSGCARDANNLDSTGNFIVTGTEITGPAENTRFFGNGSHLTMNGITFQEGTLKFIGHTNLCMGTKNPGTDPNLYTRHCSGDTGIIWLHGRANGADVWINRLWSQSSVNGAGDFQVLEGFDPGAQVLNMIVTGYASHQGFARYEFR
jgi:hypothetical protein